MKRAANPFFVTGILIRKIQIILCAFTPRSIKLPTLWALARTQDYHTVGTGERTYGRTVVYGLCSRSSCPVSERGKSVIDLGHDYSFRSLGYWFLSHTLWPSNLRPSDWMRNKHGRLLLLRGGVVAVVQKQRFNAMTAQTHTPDRHVFHGWGAPDPNSECWKTFDT